LQDALLVTSFRDVECLYISQRVRFDCHAMSRALAEEKFKILDLFVHQAPLAFNVKTRGLCERRPGLILPGKRRATRRATIDVAVVSVRETTARFGGGGLWNAYDDWKPEFPAPSPAGFTSACFLSSPSRIATVRVPFAHPTRFACPPLKAFSQIPPSDHPDVEALATHQLLLTIRARSATKADTPGGSRYAIIVRATLRPSIWMVPRD
jgi:hypothetical protein